MTSIPRKSYDTDILTIRKFFLRNPINNVPISSGYLMFANVDGIGYMNPSSLSTSLQTQQGLSSLSSLIGTNFFITQSALSTLSTSIGTGGGGSGDVTVANLASTTRGLGSAGYLSSLTGFQISTGFVQASTVNFIDTGDSSKQVMEVNNGTLKINGATIAGGGGISQSQLNSTLNGLGTLNFLSTLTLTSTIIGLGTAGYISTAGANQESITSTLQGLGSAGYLSTVSFSNVISTSFYDTNTSSTIKGLGTTGYLSSIQWSNVISTSFYDTNTTSTVEGLGTFGYLSSIQWSNVISTSFYDTNTTSTVEGLGTFGYLSTLSLLSTVGRLQTITNSTIGGWAYTPASSDILLNTNITTRLKNTNPNAVLQIESLDVSIQDPLSAWANLDIGTLNLKTSSSDEYYTLGFNPIATGTISSFLIARYNGLVTAPAGLYISSLFLGNFGGTTNGQLTTDETATDIYWNNSKLNSQTGGGGGTVSFTFVSTNSLSSIFVSSGTSFFNYNSTKTTTADVLNFSSLFVNNIPILVDSNGNLLVTSQTI